MWFLGAINEPMQFLQEMWRIIFRSYWLYFFFLALYQLNGLVWDWYVSIRFLYSWGINMKKQSFWRASLEIICITWNLILRVNSHAMIFFLTSDVMVSFYISFTKVCIYFLCSLLSVLFQRVKFVHFYPSFLDFKSELMTWFPILSLNIKY